MKTRTDQYGNIRTVINVGPQNGQSFAVEDNDGRFLGLLNIFTDGEGTWWAVDAIDTDDQFDRRAVLHFTDGLRTRIEVHGKVLAADFRKTE